MSGGTALRLAGGRAAAGRVAAPAADTSSGRRQSEGVPSQATSVGSRRSAGWAQRAETPSSLMVPRVLFASMAAVLVLFGLIMIYSSSSITAMLSSDTNNDPTYYFLRQAAFAGIGVVCAIGLAVLDYRRLRGTLVNGAWVVTLLGLLVVYIPSVGQETLGASRWIDLGPFTLQPSEFAKVTIVLVGVLIMERYFGEGSLEPLEAAKWVFVGIGIPLLLILLQPDKGTTGIIVLTLMIMMYLSGVPGPKIALACVGIVALAMVYALKDDYSRARIMTMFHPERDPYGDGYQLMQGYYALGYGGLSGTGLGLSRQKYNYLPMAYNDFIFTIIGEELGFVGAVALLAAFCVLLWSGFKIAQHANDLAGRLLAAGCTSLLAVQLLLNVSGVLGIFPLSGKPVPFISYGGSSIISCLLLVGLTLSVSFHSTLPETGYERRRAQMRMATAQDEASDVGEPVARRGRRSLRVIEGGASEPRASARQSTARIVTDASGRRRLDLGSTPAERLRGRK